MLRYAMTLLAVALLATPALAQQRVQQTGRLLDANPQVGSRGLNTYSLEALTDYQSRNAVITGNVAGGRHFRGNINYGAPGSFGLGTGSGLPSDDLYPFERRSAPSAPAQLNTPYVGAYAGQNTSRIYRGSTDLPAYETGGAALGRSLLQSSTGVQVLPDELVNALKTQRDLAPNRQNLGTITDTTGRQYELSASPLLGLRRTPVSPSLLVPDMEPLPDAAPRAPQNAPTRVEQEPGLGRDALNPERRPQAEEAPAGPAPLERAGLRQNFRREAQLAGRGVGLADVFIDQPARQSGLLIGEQLQQRMDPVLPGRALSDRVTALEDRFFGRAGSAQQPAGQDVYLDLLRAARDQAQGPAQARRERLTPGDEHRQVELQQPGDDQAREDALGAVAAPGLNLPAPAPEQIEAVEQRRMAVLERLQQQRESLQAQQRELAQRIRSSAREQELRQEAEERGDASIADDRAVRQAQAEAQAALKQLVDQLNYDLPPVKTMAGDAERRHNEMVRSAERQLASGAYMDAAALYKQANIEAPQNPMIRAGLVHAQLGAGMMRSAALNLRRLLEEHPQLAAARYDPQLLPGAERLRIIQQELQRMINQGVAVDEAGLLTAYLGYQAGSRQLTRYGLGVAQSAAPEDAIFPLLRAIWLDEQAEGASAEQGPAAPADNQASDQPAPITQ
jgi:hypothetical protein